MNWVRTRLALERMAPGAILEVEVDPGEPIESVPRSAREDGHAVSVVGNVITIIRRTGP
jgi:TusA-related sulfurtransferase